MPISFPANPAINQQHETGGRTWTWDGVRWMPDGVGVIVTNVKPTITTSGRLWLDSEDATLRARIGGDWVALRGRGGQAAIGVAGVSVTTQQLNTWYNKAGTTGGDTVTINGSGFQPGVRVFVDNLECTVTAVTPTSITFVTPAAAAGLYHLFIYNPDGTNGVKANALEFINPPTTTTTSTTSTSTSTTSTSTSTTSTSTSTTSTSTSTSTTTLPPISNGQSSYSSAGTYSWVAPTGITSVSAVAVGGGGAGEITNAAGGGGGLGWQNAIAVIPGQSYTVVVGSGGATNGVSGTDSYFINTSTVRGMGGAGGTTVGGAGGSFVGQGGGTGGTGGGWGGGGGGAGGYTGAGGNGGQFANDSSASGINGAGGGAGGGGGGPHASHNGLYIPPGGGGGGTGLLGQGTNGTGAVVANNQGMWPGYPGGGTGGSGGGNGAGSPGCTGDQCNWSGVLGGPGGSGGGGSGASMRGEWGYNKGPNNPAGAGGVRIIWGNNRSFPSTNTGDL